MSYGARSGVTSTPGHLERRPSPVRNRAGRSSLIESPEARMRGHAQSETSGATIALWTGRRSPWPRSGAPCGDSSSCWSRRSRWLAGRADFPVPRRSPRTVPPHPTPFATGRSTRSRGSCVLTRG